MRRLIWRGSCVCGRVPSGLRPRIESVVMSSALMVRTDEELVARKADWTQPEPRYRRGVLAKYAASVTSASEGAVTDKDL